MNEDNNVPERIWIQKSGLSFFRTQHNGTYYRDPDADSIPFARVHAPTGKVSDGDAPQVDWRQVVLNGGPPCFFVEKPQFCGRAKRWPGHGNEAFHNYVSLGDYVATIRQEEREAAFRDGIETASAVQNDNELNDGGYFEAGFIAARTRIVDALINASATKSKGETE
jgi:hypothetical protein